MTWDVFHGDRQLPTHPFGGPPQAGQGAAGGAAPSNVQHGVAAPTPFANLDAPTASDSAKKRRSKRVYDEAIGTRNLASAFGGAGMV